MTVNTILIPFTDANSGTSLLETALVVARKFTGHVEAIHVPHNLPRDRSRDGSLLLAGSSGFGSEEAVGILSDSIDDARREREKIAKDARDRFDMILADKGIEYRENPSTLDHPSAAWRSIHGQEAEVVSSYGGVFDLIVVGHPQAGTGATADETVHGALFGAGRAVLVAPEKPPQNLGEVVLVGWNRSIQSGRAVAGAMPFLLRAKTVTIVAVTTGAKQGPSPQELARQLAWHGVRAEVKEIAPDHRSVTDVLLSEAGDMAADLLVMGAYSHHRLRESILGGVTKAILARAPIPVLMAH